MVKFRIPVELQMLSQSADRRPQRTARGGHLKKAATEWSSVLLCAEAKYKIFFRKFDHTVI